MGREGKNFIARERGRDYGSLHVAHPFYFMRAPFLLHFLAVACTLAGLAQRPTASAQAGGQLSENKLSYSDEDFIQQLYQDVITSRRLAGLAVNSARKASVRQLGGNVVDSLRAAQEQIKVFAKRKSITLSDDLIAQNQDVVDKLTNAGGDDFDKTYVDTILKFLPKILQNCQTTAASTQDADLKALLAGIIPSLQGRIAAVQGVKLDL